MSSSLLLGRWKADQADQAESKTNQVEHTELWFREDGQLEYRIWNSTGTVTIALHYEAGEGVLRIVNPQLSTISTVPFEITPARCLRLFLAGHPAVYHRCVEAEKNIEAPALRFQATTRGWWRRVKDWIGSAPDNLR